MKGAAFTALALAAFACDDPDAADSALSLLEHGSVAASADCYSNWQWFWSASPKHNRFKVQLMADGAVMVSRSQADSLATLEHPVTARFCGRSESCAVPEFTLNNEYSGHTHTADYLLDSGRFTVTLNGEYIKEQVPPYANISPYVIVDEDIETACTGFNLEAFGVE